jgi:hypothetical protein
MKPELAGKLAGLEPPVDRPEIKTKATPQCRQIIDHHRDHPPTAR